MYQTACVIDINTTELLLMRYDSKEFRFREVLIR